MDVDLPSGTIVRYSYLWRWQCLRGETEGRKERPACVAIAVRDAKHDLTHLVLLAISSQPPADKDEALEIPLIECRRGGLDDLKQAWIAISEYNYDVAERSLYLDVTQPVLGRFSRPFMKELAQSIAPLLKRSAARIDRVEE